MNKILLFGAGKSATALIHYLKQLCAGRRYTLVVGDSDVAAGQAKVGNDERAKAIAVDVTVAAERQALIADADVVVSLLPPALHYLVALDCLALGRHLFTASYIDPQLKKLEQDITAKGLLFLCEMGLDPGIDHMSSMKMINDIREKGGVITSYLSHCGGLVAPESDDNPWHYKISWNPRNVVVAGKAGARFLQEGKEVFAPYEALFAGNHMAEVGEQKFAWYPNRDSLGYIDTYGLQGIHTFIRTTLRHPDFIKGWNQVVRLHLADDDTTVAAENLSYKALLLQLAEQHGSQAFVAALQQALSGGLAGPYKPVIEQLRYLGFDTDEKLPDGQHTTAALLQRLLEEKLMLKPDDKDMVVMHHEIEYQQEGKRYKKTSNFVAKGENSTGTAMSKTVGLPLGIAVSLLMEGIFDIQGLHIPISKTIYEPVLAELAVHGIRFNEQIEAL